MEIKILYNQCYYADSYVIDYIEKYSPEEGTSEPKRVGLVEFNGKRCSEWHVISGRNSTDFNLSKLLYLIIANQFF